jgi:hypothetical protein
MASQEGRVEHLRFMEISALAPMASLAHVNLVVEELEFGISQDLSAKCVATCRQCSQH